MKLLVVISYYYPNISGLTIYAERVVEEMVERGFAVEVLTSLFRKGLSKQEKINGVLVKRIWTPFMLGRGPMMPTFIFDSLISVSKADVVNCHLPDFEAVFVALWAKILGKRLITTYQCDLSDWPGLINKISVRITNLSHHITCLLSEKIICLSKDYADNSRFLVKFKNKLVYIFPPIKLAKPNKNRFKNWNSIKYKIGFVGRIAREKGIEFLLNSIPLLKDKLGKNFMIFLAGPTGDVIGGGYKDSIKSLLEKYKDNIVILGKMPDEDLSGFYEKIDVFVLPSVESMEAFGMAQVEAMLSGCPVVATDIPGVRIPVKLSGMGEIVPKKDSMALSGAIIRILQNKKKYFKTRKSIEAIFDNKKTMDLYEKLYKNLS